MGWRVTLCSPISCFDFIIILFQSPSGITIPCLQVMSQYLTAILFVELSLFQLDCAFLGQIVVSFTANIAILFNHFIYSQARLAD